MTLKFKASIAGALALTLAATLAAGGAFAQPGAGGGAGGDGGRGAALRQACSADIQKFCGSVAMGPDMRACVRKNYDQMSEGCRSFLAQMRSRRSQQGQGAPPAAAPQ